MEGIWIYTKKTKLWEEEERKELLLARSNVEKQAHIVLETRNLPPPLRNQPTGMKWKVMKDSNKDNQSRTIKQGQSNKDNQTKTMVALGEYDLEQAIHRKQQWKGYGYTRRSPNSEKEEERKELLLAKK